MSTVAKKPEISYERKPNTLHAFFALKFHEGDADRAKVESIEKALKKAGIEITLMARDVEKWGKATIPEGKTLMRDFAFPAMRRCDCNIIEFSEKGVGLGMNAGFCHGIKKPIYVIAKVGSDISTTMANVAEKVIFYDKPEDLIEPFREIVSNFPRAILASGSTYRRLLLAENHIPFEVMKSDVDETPDESRTRRDQVAEIAMRKAMAVFKRTKDRGPRLIMAADQNLVFGDKMLKKPKTIDEARAQIKPMLGSDEVYAYTGNAILWADKDQILESINLTDIARLSYDNISKNELEEYLETGDPLSVCGGANINNAPFVHLEEGRLSTARGFTVEYANEMYRNLF